MPSEREKKFLEYCKELERVLDSGKSLQPTKRRVAGRAVHGDTVTPRPAEFTEIDRSESEKHLRYIESESKEFPRIAAKYRPILDEAIRQYKSFIG